MLEIHRKNYDWGVGGTGSEKGKGPGGSDGSHGQERSQMWEAVSFTSAFKSYWSKGYFSSQGVCGR